MIATDHETRDRAHFNATAPSYCAKDLSRSSSRARRLRLEQTLRCVPLTGDVAILEIGCGAGFSARFLAGQYREYVGIDYAEEFIRFARDHNALPGAQFEVANIKDYQSPQQFDVALLIGVLHHLDDLQGSLLKTRGLLKPGGWIIANEPQPSNPMIRMARAVRKRIDSSYSSEQRELSGGELERSLTEAGFVGVKLVPQGVFSTPFAEVVLRPEALASPVAAAASLADRFLEARLGGVLKSLSWNLIVVGRKPLDA